MAVQILFMGIFGLCCFVAGIQVEQNKEECPNELMGYRCKNDRYSMFPTYCDHSQRRILETKLAMLGDDDDV